MPQRPLADTPLCNWFRELAATYASWGVPLVHWKRKRDGWQVNYKRVERLYRLEGLAFSRRTRKQLAAPRVPRPEAEGPNDT